MAKKLNLNPRQIEIILKMYNSNLKMYGEPKYRLILEELSRQNPPIITTKQTISYHIKKLLEERQSCTLEQQEREESLEISKPELYLENNIEDFKPLPSISSNPLHHTPGLSSHSQISSLLEASRIKKEVETEILKERLGLMKGKLRPVSEVEDEKFALFKMFQKSLETFQNAVFQEAEPLLLAKNRIEARTVLRDCRHRLIDELEQIMFNISLNEINKKRHKSPQEWAEDKRILSEGESPWTGKFSYKLVPFMKEIVACFAEDSVVREVVLKKGSQVMGTTCLTENIIGYYMDVHPCNILVVAPTVQLLEMNVQPRIVKMLKSADLEDILTAAPKKNLLKFKGGQLFFAGSTRPDRFRNISAKVLVLEELSGFPKKYLQEGSIKDLARARTKVFESTRKILYISSALKNGDDIDTLFESGDARYFEVPCPHCKTFQSLKFANLRYTKTQNNMIKDVYYSCLHCSKAIYEYEKPQLFEKGQWVASKRENARDDFRSYHLSGLYSPFGLQSWNEICKLYEEAKESEDAMQVFQNTVLGENYNKEKIIIPNLVELSLNSSMPSNL